MHAGGGAFAHWHLFREGLESGSDPADPEYWLETSDRNQRSVEIAALGFAIALAPDALWQPLPDAAKKNLAAWIKVIETVAMADNNWHFFPVLAGLGLERVGVPIDAASRERHLNRIDDFVRADGWYGDGAEPFIDHYNGFALHFYGLLYAHLAQDRDPVRAQEFRERARAFAQGYRHWFGRDGAGLAIGRSLTYRFAMAAFFGALAYADVEALPWGEIRGLWARHMRWWMRQPMLDAVGRLSIGYAWPNLLMSEEYNSPGSPYWAFKAFLPLALPETHPFWQAREVLPKEPAEPVTIAGASMVVQHIAGDVVALPAGPVRVEMRNSRDKYGKFAYSTRFGLAVEAERWVRIGFFGDNILAFSVDGRDFHARGALTGSRIGEGFVETEWSPLDGVAVTTLQGFLEGWEVRLHRVATERPATIFESGHAVPTRCGTRERLRDLSGAEAGPAGLVLILDDGHRTAIADLLGTRRAAAIDVAPNTHLLFPHAAVPMLRGSLGAGEHLLATAVRASFGADDGAPPPGREAVAAFAQSAGWALRPDRLSADVAIAIQRQPAMH